MRERRGAVIGRDGEIRTLTDALRATGGAARVLLVTAGAGMGRTTVLEEARRTAARAGTAVVGVGPAGEDDATCGLVLTNPDDRLAGLPAAVRSRLRAAGRIGGVKGLSALSGALASAARRVPLALVVDDVDQLPPYAADALGLLLRVFRPYGVPVVMTAGHARPPADHLLELPPLRPADVAGLVDLHVTRRFGRPADPALADAVSLALGSLAGNPRAVLSVLGTLDERDLLELDGLMCLTRPASCLRLAVEDAFPLGFGRSHEPPYSGTVEAAIVTARVLDHAEVHVDDAFRMTPSAGARALERRLDRLITDGVLAADARGRLSFAVPALAATLRALPFARDVQANSARYVTSLAERIGAEATGRGHPRLADRVAESGTRVPDSVAVPLLLAAAREEARTDWHRSARAYAAALTRLAPDDPRTPGVLREASGLSLRHGDHEGLLALGEPLRAVLDASPTPSLEGVAAARAWAALHQHRMPDDEFPTTTEPTALGGPLHAALNPPPAPGPESIAAAQTRAALHQHRTPDNEFPAAGELAALGGLYGIGPLTSGRVPVADQMPGAAPEHPPHPLTPLPSPAELRLVAAALGSRTELNRARRQLPIDALDAGSLERLRQAAAHADLSGAFTAVLGDRYVTAADSVAAQYRGMVRDHLAGDWDSALAAARRIEVHNPVGTPYPARALAAEIHCARGDLVHARTWLGLVPDSLTHPLAGRARLAVRYWSGGAEEALERAWYDARRARKDGQLAGVERLLLGVLSLAALDDRPYLVQQVVEELETLHEEADAPLTHEALLLARGLADHDTDSALAAHRMIERRGDADLRVLCCMCLTHIADDPRPWLADAVREARRLGLGGPFRTAAHRAARVRGIPLPRLRRADEKLSDADARLLRMVSDGATNRRIAAELACSHKTVEQRLARLFQRTGCRSRTELAAFWLNENLTQPRTAADPTDTGR
ncbi:helix-turn-helix transcriptional regulator [Streptomyces acidiscabies]|uniref:helix-turn-helix transcriptional regulator n=1 Tax=Streptomyces acidiscabies TaxID=42234 RepID=UPI0009514D37|nr:LuxR family transcriptional regulator [Streptomyces acidiscabies]